MSGNKLCFTKMHGCGNDYIYFNCVGDSIENPEKLAVRLSDRHKGIGGDGIVLICPSELADAKMRMFNIDGSEGKMCGNAIRCVAKYLWDREMVRKEEIHIETLSGIKTCWVHAVEGLADTVTVDMGSAVLAPAKIPVNLAGDVIVRRYTEVAGGIYDITCVSMGNPHCIVFGEDPDGLDLESLGPAFEHDPLFPERVNTEFVQVLGPNTLKMRVWERGSGETMACGTGACASAVAAVLCGSCKMGADIVVRLRGGDLVVNYTEDRVLMAGEAREIFEGSVEV